MPLQPIHEAALAGDEAGVVRHVREDAGRLNARVQGYAEVDGCAMEGWTPLMLGALKGHDAVARLLALGADVGMRTMGGSTAAHWACGSKHASSLSLLLDAGAEINPCNANGWTPLTLALVFNALDCIKLLLARGGSALELDARDKRGCGALHLAAGRSSEIVRLLLQVGADPTIRNKYGRTPLDLARINHQTESIAPLQAALAEPQRPRSLFKARALIDAAHEQRHFLAAGADHRIDTAKEGTEDEDEDDDEDTDNTAAAAPAPLRRSSRIADKARVVAAAPAYLRGRVERREPLPFVEVDCAPGDNTNEHDNEELTACLRFVLGLEGHGGWAGAEDERATMRTEGLFPELFIELLELLVPRWDGARKGRPLGERQQE